MKKHLQLFLLLFAFAGFAKAQGPASAANWFGYILPSSPAEYKYISFTMQDIGSVSIASDALSPVSTATFADGYVWSVNNDNGNNICRSRFDAANSFIEAPEVMVANVPYVNDMAYNPADGLIYIIVNEHLKSFDPANPNTMQDHGVIEHDGFNLAINMEGDAYMISSWGEFGSLNLSNAQLTMINSIDLPIKMAFDMLTGELFGAHYGNLYQLDPNTGTYSMLGALHDGSTGYDPTCLFMTYNSNPTEFTVDDLIYRVNDDNVSVTVIGHVDGYNAQGVLVIPESVSYEGHNYAVTVIGNNAFKGIRGMTSIEIPSSVVSIGNNAFATCFDLTGDLVIPNSVTHIGESAFFQCEGLNGKLVIGESVSNIGDWAFRKCSHISEAVSLATTPPTLGTDLGGMVFAEFGISVLTVPCGCVDAYQNSAWYDPYGMYGFYEFIEDCTAIAEVDPVVTSVYPNPTHGPVKIEAENIKNVGIFNVLGEKVFEGSVNGAVFEYDFSHQNAGIYIIKVETAKGTETRRVTVK